VSKKPSMQPVALTIAGSDSGGGAGIQADLKTFQAFGVFGTSAITAITAQNTLGVDAVETVNPTLIVAQIEAVWRDLSPVAVKTGMLADAEGIEAVAAAVRTAGFDRVVVDPVMVATSGARLLEAQAVETLAREMIPLASLVTPNIPEAEVLAGRRIEFEKDMSEAARTIVARGADAALIKGGHLEGAEIVDLLWDGSNEYMWRTPRLTTTDTHGTGCTLSAAVAAGLALGSPLVQAVEAGLRYTHDAIATAPGLGGGHGPLNHSVRPHSGC